MSRICVLAKVSGHVQGVGFRYHTAHEGLKLGLTGYAKNLADGDVEVLACGQQSDVQVLLRWLENGPRTATVDHLETEEVDWRHVEGFSIR
ncbi:acylphosphatase [Parasalinivibrio latis]|uniref:acylphosphatase n=1 Tax=Parasalinivibrio latis TaxID=2952610 RepID=UPI0030E15E30